MKILIADNELEIVALMKEYLEKKGCDVEVAYDGAHSFELIKFNKFDLVFLDHNMPEVTGLELTTYIKKNFPDIKVVMITGYQQIDGFVAKSSGADEYLTKPFSLKVLDEILIKYKI